MNRFSIFQTGKENHSEMHRYGGRAASIKQKTTDWFFVLLLLEWNIFVHLQLKFHDTIVFSNPVCVRQINLSAESQNATRHFLLISLASESLLRMDMVVAISILATSASPLNKAIHSITTAAAAVRSFCGNNRGRQKTRVNMSLGNYISWDDHLLLANYHRQAPQTN